MRRLASITCILAAHLFTVGAANTVGESMIVLGKGVPGQIEIGMTLRELRRQRSDLLVAPNHSKSQQKGKATGFSIDLLSFGLSTEVYSEDTPIALLNFNVDPSSSNYFTGRLSCGIDFEKGKAVTRDAITKILGDVTVDPNATNIISHLREGKNVAWQIDPRTEVLYYPSNGVSFRLQSNAVNTVTVFAKTSPKL